MYYTASAILVTLCKQKTSSL